MLATTIAYLKGKTGLERVTFCLFAEESFQAFRRELESQPG